MHDKEAKNDKHDTELCNTGIAAGDLKVDFVTDLHESKCQTIIIRLRLRLIINLLSHINIIIPMTMVANPSTCISTGLIRQSIYLQTMIKNSYQI